MEPVFAVASWCESDDRGLTIAWSMEIGLELCGRQIAQQVQFRLPDGARTCCARNGKSASLMPILRHILDADAQLGIQRRERDLVFAERPPKRAMILARHGLCRTGRSATARFKLAEQGH